MTVFCVFPYLEENIRCLRYAGAAKVNATMNAYLTGTGAFLPGPPIDNAQIEAVLGLVEGKPSRLKSRILKANGIQTRHYAIDSSHRTTHSNVEMAVAAARQCLDESPVPVRSIGMLSCATTQGDMVVPGFGSMVQAGLGVPAVELLTAHGICSSSVMAVKAAANSLRLGEHSSALVVVSELASRLLKSTRYEAAGGHATLDFNAEFLRWMLSDGAGAWLLEGRPRGRCLRVDWIRTFSHADAFPVCMGIGFTDRHQRHAYLAGLSDLRAGRGGRRVTHSPGRTAARPDGQARSRWGAAPH